MYLYADFWKECRSFSVQLHHNKHRNFEIISILVIDISSILFPIVSSSALVHNSIWMTFISTSPGIICSTSFLILEVWNWERKYVSSIPLGLQFYIFYKWQVLELMKPQASCDWKCAGKSLRKFSPDHITCIVTTTPLRLCGTLLSGGPVSIISPDRDTYKAVSSDDESKKTWIPFMAFGCTFPIQTVGGLHRFNFQVMDNSIKHDRH